MSEQHPTIPGVTVDTGKTWRDIHHGKDWVFADTQDDTILIKGSGIPLAKVETVIAMIRDQAAWLESQKETK